MDLHVETFAIAPLVEDVIDTIGPARRRKTANESSSTVRKMLRDACRPDAPCRQALLQSVSNANKVHRQHGRVTVDVRESWASAAKKITMAVAEPALECRPSKMGRLFHEFVQADPSTTRKYGGTGLASRSAAVSAR